MDIDYRNYYNRQNGQFLKGHIPHNKGKKWTDYMDMRKAKRVIRIGMKNLQRGNPDIGGWNKRKVVAITDSGEWYGFNSAAEASRKFGLCRENISKCCAGKRKKCGPYRWFFFDDDSWLKLVDQSI